MSYEDHSRVPPYIEADEVVPNSKFPWEEIAACLIERADAEAASVVAVFNAKKS